MGVRVISKTFLAMSCTVVEFFKVNNDMVVPIEYRFIRCKILFGSKEQETCHWMNSDLWKELIEASALILKSATAEVPSKEFKVSEPILTTTKSLKVAYILKINEFKESRLMESTDKSNGRFEFKYNSKIMIVMSVSLNGTEIKIQDLKTALPLSQAEGQLKISDYFS